MMEVVSTAAPMLHLVSIFSCLNSMGDVLYSENVLNEYEKYQPIPILNALYFYFSLSIDKSKNDREKYILDFVKKLDSSCVDNVNDLKSIEKSFTNIIEQIVFGEDGGLSKYIETITKNASEEESKVQLVEDSLIEKEYKNENGKSVKLTKLSVDVIIKSIVEPFFYRSYKASRHSQ